MTRNTNGFAPLILILIIGLVAMGSLVIIKQRIETGNKTPTNEQANPQPTTPTPTPTINQSKSTTNKIPTATPTPTTPENNSNANSPTPTPTKAQVSGNVIQITTPTSTPTTTPTPIPTGLSTSDAKLNVSSVNITMKQGETKNSVFTITSISASSYTTYGYPTSYGSGINWGSGGGMIVGSTVGVNFEAITSTPPGTYSGTGIIKLYPSNNQINLPITVTVIQ